MAEKKKPPRWEEGERTSSFVVPAEKSESGKEETFETTLVWKVYRSKRMTERDRIQQEIDYARRALERADSGVSQSWFNPDDLGSALMHAITAWCWTHLRGKGISNFDNYSAFDQKAPDALRKQVSVAKLALYNLKRGQASPSEAVAAFRSVIDSLLEAAAHPPRSRRRFPARIRVPRPLHKPRVKPGGWIDTGRYRPAQVLAVMDRPPHIMSLTYGDEIDDDFRPHVTDWKPIRMRKRPPSLKDVFGPGDWIRHFRFGYGHVHAVRDSTMDVVFGDRTERLVPDAKLQKIEKVDSPVREDTRPVPERFPPGTWIEHDGWGTNMVVAAAQDSLTVLGSDRLFTFIVSGGPVVWKLDRPPLDLTLPRERRRIWFWQHRDACGGCRPCPCCGYPNLGMPDEFDVEARQCLICGWADEWDREEDADEVRDIPDLNDPMDWEWPNWGYSLTEARANFEAHGLMFRSGDARAEPFEKATEWRASLRDLLDKLMSEAPDRHRESWSAVEQFRKTFVNTLTR